MGLLSNSASKTEIPELFLKSFISKRVLEEIY